MEINNFKKNKITLLTNEQQKSDENAKNCYICKEKFEDNHVKDKKYCKVRDHCHYTDKYTDFAHSICNLKFSVPKEIPIVSHNGSNYDDLFIIKEIAEGQFTCLGENTEKYITCTVSIKRKVTRNDKNGKEITKAISYRLQFTDSARFMVSSLLNLLNILLKEFLKLNVNTNMLTKI